MGQSVLPSKGWDCSDAGKGPLGFNPFVRDRWPRHNAGTVRWAGGIEWRYVRCGVNAEPGMALMFDELYGEPRVDDANGFGGDFVARTPDGDPILPEGSKLSGGNVTTIKAWDNRAVLIDEDIANGPGIAQVGIVMGFKGDGVSAGDTAAARRQRGGINADGTGGEKAAAQPQAGDRNNAVARPAGYSSEHFAEYAWLAVQGVVPIRVVALTDTGLFGFGKAASADREEFSLGVNAGHEGSVTVVPPVGKSRVTGIRMQNFADPGAANAVRYARAVINHPIIMTGSAAGVLSPAYPEFDIRKTIGGAEGIYPEHG